jgi:hypothetical protein
MGQIREFTLKEWGFSWTGQTLGSQVPKGACVFGYGLKLGPFGWQMIHQSDQILDQVFRRSTEGQFNTLMAAKQVGGYGKRALVDVGEQKGRSLGCHHPTLYLRDDQVGTEGQVDDPTFPLLDQAGQKGRGTAWTFAAHWVLKRNFW